MTDAPKLKPCPFCGGKACAYPQTCKKSDPERPGDRAFPIVRCSKCFAEVGGENFPRRFGETSSAIQNWNARADLAKPRVKPLVWVEHRNDYWSAKGTGYQVASNRDGTWRVKLDGKVIFRRRRTFKAAIAATNDHNEARVLACLEGYGDE